MKNEKIFIKNFEHWIIWEILVDIYTENYPCNKKCIIKKIFIYYYALETSAFFIFCFYTISFAYTKEYKDKMKIKKFIYL